MTPNSLVFQLQVEYGLIVTKPFSLVKLESPDGSDKSIRILLGPKKSYVIL